MISAEAREWRDKYSREVAAKVTLEIEVARLQHLLVEVRESADRMVKDAEAGR